jgi:glutaredoxin
MLALWLLGRNDEMPVEVQRSQQSMAATGMPPQEPQPQQATSQQAQPVVVLYTTAWCNVCAKTKQYLSRHGIRYTEHDVERSPEAWREYKQYAGDGVPLIVIGETATRGFNERWIRDRLGPWLDRPRS